MIPEHTVLFEDTTPYHEHEMYKSLLFWHFPLLTRAIPLGTNMEETDINGSFSFIRRTTPEYNSNDYDRIINLPLKEERIIFKHFIFNKSSANKCFVTGCENRFIRVFVANRTMFILFNTGIRIYDTRSLDKGLSLERDEESYLSNPNIVKKDIFYEFLQFIKDICTEHDITQIVLSGHSNGSDAATITAFILVSMFYPVYRERNADIIGDWHDDIERWQGEFAMLNKSIFLVCTGTIPVLFTKQSQFIDFYKHLKGRYVSVLSGVYVLFPDGKKDIYIDYFSSPIYDLHLYKYGIYCGNINERGESIEPYRGIVSFYKIIINPDYSPYDDWKIIVDDKTHRLVLSNETSNKKIDFDARGFSFNSDYTKVHPSFKDVDTNKLLTGFDRIGNQFINCSYDIRYFKYNRPAIKECSEKDKVRSYYELNPHDLSFYRYLLSIFIYGVRHMNQHDSVVFDEGGQSLGVKRAKKNSRKKRAKKNSRKKRQA